MSDYRERARELLTARHRGYLPDWESVNLTVMADVLSAEFVRIAAEAEARRSATGQRRRERFRGTGRCVQCGREPEPSDTLCRRCRSDRVAYHRARRRQFKEARACQVCGHAVSNGVRCATCLTADAKRQNRKRLERARAERCQACGGERGPRGTRIFCRPCADTRAARTRRRRAVSRRPNVCRRCLGPLGTGPMGKLCQTCWVLEGRHGPRSGRLGCRVCRRLGIDARTHDARNCPFRGRTPASVDRASSTGLRSR